MTVTELTGTSGDTARAVSVYYWLFGSSQRGTEYQRYLEPTEVFKVKPFTMAQAEVKKTLTLHVPITGAGLQNAEVIHLSLPSIRALKDFF